MGARLSSAGTSNGSESSHSSTSAGMAAAELSHPTSLASGGYDAQSAQPGTSGTDDAPVRTGSASKHSRLPETSSVVNGRQLLEVLAASGVSGRSVVTRSGQSAARSIRSADESSVNRSLIPPSLPFLIAFRDVKCPVCHKMIPSDDVECHLVMCLTKPKVIYNEEVLNEDKDQECVICLEELKQDDIIARLPCLCIYHKSCIDRWFEVNRSCPEHPDGLS